MPPHHSPDDPTGADNDAIRNQMAFKFNPLTGKLVQLMITKRLHKKNFSGEQKVQSS
jgi:hypothetical protein